MFKACFTDYQSPSNMYKKLSETKDAVNEIRVDFIKKSLRKLKRMIHLRLKGMKMEIVERILYFNQLNQAKV